jgi:prepilin-type processing-associated H-X9-DG protein
MALVSLICGVLLCVPLLPSLAAIITGALGIRKSKDPAVSGKGMAVAGLTLGIVGLVGWAGYALLMASILVPSLGRARETANRVKCAANMRQIGLAILLYSNENRGAYPPRLEDLLLTQDITSQAFVCPSTPDTPAPGTSPQTFAQNLSTGGHLSYVYVGADMTNTTASPATIVLYEAMTNHANDGMNVLYGDGHVEFQTAAEAQRILNELNSGHNPPRPPGGAMGSIVDDVED